MPDKTWERVDSAFTFFRRKALNNEPFTLIELATFTQWKLKTVKTYITKQWSGFLACDGAQYRCTNTFSIRNEAIHFVHNDPALSVRVQQIGAASLRNFMTLAAQWFGYDFTQFNFYLMPISFFHQSDVESFSVDNNAKDNLLRYLKQVESSYSDDADPNFSISLILHTRLVKTGDDDAVEVRVTDDPSAPALQISEEDALKGYPYTYHALCEQLRKRYRNFKQNSEFYDIKKRLEVQGDRFCKERKLDPNNPKSLYKKFYHSRILEEFDKYYEKA